MNEHNYFLDALIFLSAAIVAVPVAKRLGLGSVLGYLIGGVLIGPYVLGLIKDAEAILHFSEFGVVLLLFLIGLELNPSRLWSMRTRIFGLGGSQVVVTMVVLALTGILLGYSWQVSLVAAAGLSLSSTAIALQTLDEKRLMNTLAGQNGFAVLLFQDIAIIPMIALLPLLAVGKPGISGGMAWAEALKAVIAIAAIVIGGRYLLSPMLKRIAALQMREMFTTFSLALVIGIAQLMDAVGLSMALGTFLAGVLLADSEYRHELEIDIEPFKGLLMGLFFISVGMSINFTLLASNTTAVIVLSALLIGTKAAILYALARQADMLKSDRLRFTAVLAQGGEFAFVLFELANTNGILSGENKSLLILAVVFSMVCTPFLVNGAEYLVARTRGHQREEDNIDDNNQHVLICGYGRYGQIIGRMLHGLGIPTTLLDSDPNQVDLVKRFGFKVFFGDASRLDLLHAAGVDKAKAVVLAIDDQATVTDIATLVRHHWPDTPILARARNRQHAIDLMKLGVTDISRETFASSLELATATLHRVGYSKHQAWLASGKFRHYDQQLMHDQAAASDDEATLIQLAHRARRDLEAIYKLDQSNTQEKKEDWGAK